MQEIRQRLNRDALDAALKSRNITQNFLAEKIGANEKSFSRWINEGYIQSKYLWDLTDALELSDAELDSILMLPKYRVFFRKKYLGEVPEEIKMRAIDLSRTLLGLTYLNSEARFFPPNASKVESPYELANQIRKYTGINSFKSLDSLISSLSEQGVEIAILPFEKMGLKGPGDHEAAFSVTNEKRCVVFLDSADPEEALIFNLCHELCHLFRPDHGFSAIEEKFCQATAAELVYPENYFKIHQAKIESVVKSESSESIIGLLNSLKEVLGGELFGLSIRLKDLGLFSQKNPFHKKIISYGESSFKNLPKIGDSFFSRFSSGNSSHFREFWKDPEIDKNYLFRFFFHIKNGAINESISARKFAELFDIEVGFSDELIHEWKLELHRKIKDS